MGLFTSECPECDAPIHWFLHAPENYVCNCGRDVSPDEIERSWYKIYQAHLEDLIAKGRDPDGQTQKAVDRLKATS